MSDNIGPFLEKQNKRRIARAKVAKKTLDKIRAVLNDHDAKVEKYGLANYSDGHFASSGVDPEDAISLIVEACTDSGFVEDMSDI